MKLFFKNILRYNIKAISIAHAIMLVLLLSACGKHDGYSLVATKVNSVIQINANDQVYSIKSAPDVISFSTATINSSAPYYRQYILNGNSTTSTTGFSLAFHIDSVGSGKYVFEGSQLTIGTKSYISLASKTTDKVTITKLDASNKVYAGNFSFYSYNIASVTDSVLVTGTYSIQ